MTTVASTPWTAPATNGTAQVPSYDEVLRGNLRGRPGVLSQATRFVQSFVEHMDPGTVAEFPYSTYADLAIPTKAQKGNSTAIERARTRVGQVAREAGMPVRTTIMDGRLWVARLRDGDA